MAFRNPMGINPPAWVSGSSAAASDPTVNLLALTIPAPSGLAVGNLLVAYLAFVALGATAPSSPGWTLRGSSAAGFGRLRCLTKTVGAGEPTDYTFTLAPTPTSVFVGIIGNFEGTGVAAFAADTVVTPPPGPIAGAPNPVRQALGVFGVASFDGGIGTRHPVVTWPAGVNKRLNLFRWTGAAGVGLVGFSADLTMFDQRLTGPWPAQSFTEGGAGVSSIKMRLRTGLGTPIAQNFQGGFDPRRGKFRRRPR